MEGKSVIIGLIAGACAVYYFSSKDKNKVEVIRTKTIHVNSEPEFVPQTIYRSAPEKRVIYTSGPRVNYIVPQPVEYNYYREPVFLPPHHGYRSHHRYAPHFYHDRFMHPYRHFPHHNRMNHHFHHDRHPHHFHDFRHHR